MPKHKHTHTCSSLDCSSLFQLSPLVLTSPSSLNVGTHSTLIHHPHVTIPWSTSPHLFLLIIPTSHFLLSISSSSLPSSSRASSFHYDPSVLIVPSTFPPGIDRSLCCGLIKVLPRRPAPEWLDRPPSPPVLLHRVAGDDSQPWLDFLFIERVRPRSVSYPCAVLEGDERWQWLFRDLYELHVSDYNSALSNDEEELRRTRMERRFFDRSLTVLAV
jgi:hypothetical protein